MQKVRNLRVEQFENYISFSCYTHSTVYRVFWPSDQSTAYILNIFRPSTSGTVPSTTQILRTAIKCTEIFETLYSFTYLYSLLCNAIKS